MRQRLKILAYFSIFWIVFQIVIRAVFLLYNHDLTEQLTSGEVLNVFLHGLKMDISMGGYFLMLTALILTFSIFIQSGWLYFILNAISITLIILCSIIVIVDLELYRHWGFRLDTTPIFYLAGTESEAMGSVEITVVIKVIFILLALSTIAIFIYSTWLGSRLSSLKPPTSKKKSAVVLLTITALMFIPIRGSFSVAPMNIGFVFFHKSKPFANHAAINVVWNFLYSLQQSSETEYPNNFFDKALTEKYFKSLYAEDDSTVYVFTEPKPNIIIFILETFTAKIIEPLGGVKGLTPNFNKLCSEGILFNNFFSSGDRTDKGIVSILSAYPAQPKSNIIRYPSKSQKLPYFNRFMNDLGYTTSFIYGGDIDFANFRAYLTNSRFDHITSDEDFPDELNQSKWGVHDHIVFQKALDECNSTKSPFFKVILSLSSHEPFDVPMEPYITGNDPSTKFLNSTHYTDKCIGEFITKAKQSTWWKNTVIILTADHGSRHPDKSPLDVQERYRIPLLMIGGAIKKDTIVSIYGNQTDLANTLLGQLSKTSDQFKFSKNMLSPGARSFSTYFFNNGYGFVTPDCYVVYDNTSSVFLRKNGASEEDLNTSKAYQQMLFLDYNSK